MIVPGFVDAYCHAGLSGDGTGIPSGRASQRVSDVVIKHDDKVLRRLLEAPGSPRCSSPGRDSGLVSGRVAAIKTGAEDKESMVLKEIAGIRFVHDSIGARCGQGPREPDRQGQKAYIAKWKKYEKDLADWKAGKKKTTVKKPEAREDVEEAQGDGPDLRDVDVQDRGTADSRSTSSAR